MKRLAAALLAVFWLLQLPLAAAGYDKTPVTVTLPYFHVWFTDDPAADDVFTYRWTVVTPGAPMPQGSTSEYWDWTLKGNTEGVLALDFVYDTPGSYQYRLAAYVPQPVKGYTYEPRTYLLSVLVQNAPGGGLQAEWSVLNELSGAKVDRLDLDPGYTGAQTPTEAPTEQPTQKPTEKPTQTPTEQPTRKPGGGSSSGGTSGASGSRNAARTGDENHIRSMAVILLVSALLLVFLAAEEIRAWRLRHR